MFIIPDLGGGRKNTRITTNSWSEIRDVIIRICDPVVLKNFQLNKVNIFPKQVILNRPVITQGNTQLDIPILC